jgi:DNA replication protein DnaC
MAYKKFRACTKCDHGWILNEKTEEVEKCPCLKKYQDLLESENLFNSANLPVLPENYSLSTSYIGPDKNENLKKLEIFVRQFDSKFNSISLYVVGTNGVQKTTVITAVGRQLMLSGFSVKYVLMNELIKLLTNEQYLEENQLKVKEYKECDLLIIDEVFDKQKVTLYKSNYQIPYLDEFLRIRVEKERKSTIFISNVKIEDIHNDFGTSLKSLMERNCKQSTLVFEDSINLRNSFEVKDLWS